MPRATHRRWSCSIASAVFVGSASSAAAADPQVADRDRTRLEREASQPANGRALVAAGIAVAQHQADPEGVVERDLRQFPRGTEHDELVACLQGAAKPRVGAALTCHERMFA